MTVAPVSGAEMQQWQDTGLEDMNMSDAVMPRIKIVGKEGVWSDNLTDTKMPNLYFIALGLVKQRSLFHPRVDEGDKPMCKSTNFELGFPNPEPHKEKPFPWQAAGFNPADFPADPTGQQGPLPCSGCALKDWGSHPTNTTPYCAEQWTLPIYYDASGQPAIFDANVAWDPAQAEWAPAILTLQKSSLKPIKSYLSSFKAGGKPPFLSVCKGTLKVMQRSDVLYSVPSFTKGPESPRERWNEFAVQYGEMRDFLTRPPVKDDEDDPDTGASTDNSWGGQAAQPAAAAPAQPAPTPVPAQPAEPAPAPQVAQPVAQPAPAQPAQPVQPEPVAAQPAAAQPAPQGDPWATTAVAPEPQAPAPAQPVAQPEPTPAPTAAQPAPAPSPQPAPQPVAEQPPAQPAAAPTPPAGQALPF